MKKIIKIIVLLIFVISCDIIDKRYNWYTPSQIVSNREKLQSGDILIFSKKLTPMSIFGHSSVLDENKRIVGFYSYFTDYVESRVEDLLALKRKISIFRLKNIDENFKENLFDEIDKVVDKQYGITLKKDDEKVLYCSQFVYLIYKKAGEKQNINIDLDSDGGIFVMPFDIMNSSYLENIDFYKDEEKNDKNIEKINKKINENLKKDSDNVEKINKNIKNTESIENIENIENIDKSVIEINDKKEDVLK